METERVLCVKSKVYVFAIGARQSNRAPRAADWNLGNPTWSGMLKIIANGKLCRIDLIDYQTGNLFASCPVDSYPGTSVEGVSDSSRYFILKIMNDNGRHAFIGIGFSERNDSFDFNVTLREFFSKDEKVERLKKEFENQKIDLKLKQGQKMKLKINDTTRGKIGSSNKINPNVVSNDVVCKVKLPVQVNSQMKSNVKDKHGSVDLISEKESTPIYQNVPVETNIIQMSSMKDENSLDQFSPKNQNTHDNDLIDIFNFNAKESEIKPNAGSPNVDFFGDSPFQKTETIPEQTIDPIAAIKKAQQETELLRIEQQQQVQQSLHGDYSNSGTNLGYPYGVQQDLFFNSQPVKDAQVPTPASRSGYSSTINASSNGGGYNPFSSEFAAEQNSTHNFQNQTNPFENNNSSGPGFNRGINSTNMMNNDFNFDSKPKQNSPFTSQNPFL